jgi:hypothetical protein
MEPGEPLETAGGAKGPPTSSGEGALASLLRDSAAEAWKASSMLSLRLAMNIVAALGWG